jgi:hypothetical protein
MPHFMFGRMKYGSLGASEVRELRLLREKNAKLKRLVADLTLDKHILGEIVRKKLNTGAQARAHRVGAWGLRSESASSVSAGADFPQPARLQQPKTEPRGTAPTDARTRAGTPPVRLSTRTRAASTRRLAREHEARTQALSSRSMGSCAMNV